MSVYFDTSAVVPLFFNETGTALARAEITSTSSVWVSHWTLAEFSSAVAFKLRTGQIDRITADTARQLFAKLVASRLNVVDVIREDFSATARLCATTPSPGLRTPDALHLAITRRLGFSMVTLDAALGAACRYHGVILRPDDIY